MRGMKKILALLLCLAMVLSSVPMVFAASGDLVQPENPGWSEDQDPDATEPDGDVDVPVEALYVQSIQVATLPDKTVYERGEALEIAGLTLTGTKMDGTTVTITEGFKVSGFASETVGIQTITVDYYKRTTTFQVEVVPAATRVVVTPSAINVKKGDKVTIDVSVTGDYEYTSMGYIPVTENAPYEILEAEALVNDAIIVDISKTEGGVVAYDEAGAYTGKVFRFTIQIKDVEPCKFAFTAEFNVMNETEKLDAALVESEITVYAPVENTPAEDLKVEVNEETSGIVVGGTAEDSTVKDVVIDSSYEVNGEDKTVTEIAPEAFKDNTTVETVVIPGTVTTVGQDAFTGSAVKEVTIKGSKTDISTSGIKDVANVTIVAPIGSDAHDYALEHNLAFRALLAFYSANVVLTDDLGLRYKVSEKLFSEHGYTNPYVIFEINGKQVEATSDMVVKDDKIGLLHVFSYLDIAPYMIKDTVTATLYATDKDGYFCSSEPKEYSVKNYCHDMLAHESSQGNTELQRLLVDMLNYGAAAQNYHNYHTNDLANAGLSDDEKALGTQEAPEAVSQLKTDVKIPAEVKATFKGAGLYLAETVSLRFGFEAASISGLSVKVTYKDQKGQDAVKIFTANDFVKSGSRYYVYFSELIASQMRQVVQATVYEGDTAVSNTIAYSIETYVAQAKETNNTALIDIVNAVLCYGDSAEKYANK